MNPEMMPSVQSNNEGTAEKGENERLFHIQRLLEKIHLSDGAKKNISRSIVGALALGAVESTSDNDISRLTQNRDELMNAAEWITPSDVRETVEALRGQMIAENMHYFDGVYEDMNIPIAQTSHITYSSIYVEGVDGKKRLTQEENDKIPVSGENVCIASHDVLGVVINEENQWHGYTKDVRMDAIGEAIDVRPVNDHGYNIAAKGLTKEDAIFQAFENAASMKGGIHVQTHDELASKDSDDANDLSKEYVSSSYNLCIDSYHINSIDQEDGVYKVDLHIVYGEVVQ